MGNSPMEDFLLAVLGIAVFWLVSKQLNRSSEERNLEELNASLSRFEARLRNLERVVREAAEAPVPQPGEAVAKSVPLSDQIHVVPAPSPTPIPIPKPPPSPEPLRPQPAPASEFPASGFVVRPVLSGMTQPASAAKTAASRIPPAPPPLPAPAATDPVRSLSIEERLGQNWLNKLGITALVLGVAGFLGYKLGTLGPLGKSLVGLAVSLALLGGGLLLERRSKYRIFAGAAIAGGWALTFFVTFALYHVEAMRVLHSQGVDLVLMMIAAAAMVWHSLSYKSQVVTSLAFLLAFVTVGISEVTLFSLVAGAILALALVIITAREYWFKLAIAGVAGVYLNHFLWLHRVLPEGGRPGHAFPAFFASAGLLLFYWLLFRLAYVLRVPRTPQQETFASFAAILNSAGLMSLLKFQSSHPEWAFAALLTLGVAEFVFAFVARPRSRTAFVVLSTIASLLLLAAIPFRFGSATWSLLWLLEAELLFVTGLRLPEKIFRRLGILAGFATLAQLLLIGVTPVFLYRQAQADPSRHLPLTVALLTTAILFWFNGEYSKHRWSSIANEELDRGGLGVTSYLALPAAGLGLWLYVPGDWTIAAWLVVALALAWCADRLASRDLAMQCDLLALSAVVRAGLINLGDKLGTNLGSGLGTNLGSGRSPVLLAGPLSLRDITIVLAGALLYLGMRRKTRAQGFDVDYIPALYSWAATTLLAVLLWSEIPSIVLAVAWAAFGVTLFELGFGLHRRYLLHQGYALLAMSFVRILFVDMVWTEVAPAHSRITTVAPLIVVYFWVYQRATSRSMDSPAEQFAAAAAAWAGTIATGALLLLEVRLEWVAISWALLALVLLLAGWLLQRDLFVAQSLTLLAASAGRALVFNLLAPAPVTADLFQSRLFCAGAVCLAMFLALPIAFQVRRRYVEKGLEPGSLWQQLLRQPEQSFFFVPLVLVTTLLALELRAGVITIGWSALGVLAFLFALLVGERSYRLAGLSLLLLGVGKIVFVDIWHATPTDRYITLIVMGIALLLVSFLYSRYREKILEFL